jgi:hypothetical protein
MLARVVAPGRPVIALAVLRRRVMSVVGEEVKKGRLMVESVPVVDGVKVWDWKTVSLGALAKEEEAGWLAATMSWAEAGETHARTSRPMRMAMRKCMRQSRLD